MDTTATTRTNRKRRKREQSNEDAPDSKRRKRSSSKKTKTKSRYSDIEQFGTSLVLDFDRRRDVYAVPEGVFVLGVDTEELVVHYNAAGGVLRVSDRIDVYKEDDDWKKLAASDDVNREIICKFNKIYNGTRHYTFFGVPSGVLLRLKSVEVFRNSSVVIHADTLDLEFCSITTYLKSTFSIGKTGEIATYNRIQAVCYATSTLDFSGNRVNDFGFNSYDKSTIRNLRVVERVHCDQASLHTKIRNVSVAREARTQVPRYIAESIQKEGNEQEIGQQAAYAMDGGAAATAAAGPSVQIPPELLAGLSRESAHALRKQIDANAQALREERIDAETYEQFMGETFADFQAEVSRNLGIAVPSQETAAAAAAASSTSWTEGPVMEPIGSSLQQRDANRRREGPRRSGPNHGFRVLPFSSSIIGGNMMVDAGQIALMLGAGGPPGVDLSFMSSRGHGGGVVDPYAMPERSTRAPAHEQGTAAQIIPITQRLKPSEYDKKSIMEQDKEGNSPLGKCLGCAEATPTYMCQAGHVPMCKDCTVANLAADNMDCSVCRVQSNYVELKLRRPDDMKCTACKQNFCSTACSSNGCMMLCTKCVNERIDRKEFQCPKCNGIGRYIPIRCGAFNT